MEVKYENKEKYFNSLFKLRDAINELNIKNFDKDEYTLEEIAENNKAKKYIDRCIRDVNWGSLRYKNNKP